MCNRVMPSEDWLTDNGCYWCDLGRAEKIRDKGIKCEG